MSPQPRTRLDRERILDAVLDLTSRPHVTGLNVRDLGRELGCDPSAIYRHFRGKDDLLASALDRLHGLAAARVAAAPEDWEARLLQLTAATWEVFAAHPALGMEAITTTTDGPGERDTVEIVLDALTRAGLDDDQVVRFYAVLSQYSLSVASGRARSVAGSQDESADGAGESGGWFRSAGSPDGAHPHLARLGSRLAALTESEPADLGLELILDGVRNAAG